MKRRCATCGFRSDVVSFFRCESGGLLGRRQTVCEGCSAYQPSRYEIRIASRLAVGQLIWVMPLGLSYSYGLKAALFLFVMILASLVSLPLRIVVHEFGHALAARAVGREVALITVGRGPLLFKRRIWGAPFEIRRYAFAGGRMSYFDLRGHESRWRDGVILVAGPGANAVCGVLAFGLSAAVGGAPIPAPWVAAGVFAGIAFSQVLTAVFNLVPKASGDDETVASDGAQLLRLFGPRSPVDADATAVWRVSGLIRTRRLEEAEAAALAAAEKSRFAMILLAQVVHSVSRRAGDQAAVDCYLKMQDRISRAQTEDSENAHSQAPWLQVNVAWSAIKAGGRALGGMAEPLVWAAFEAAPDAPEMKGTLGAWLVVSGDTEGGLTLLTKAVRAVEDRTDKADFCIFLARGWRARGHESIASGFEDLRQHLLAMG